MRQRGRRGGRREGGRSAREGATTHCGGPGGHRPSRERRTFSALVTCSSTVDKAMGTPYASKERKKLASKVLDCVRTMRSYRPLIPLRMHKRVMSKEAIRASQYLKALVYPAM